MYVDDDEAAADGKDTSFNDPNNESATLDRAKEAAKDFVSKHPETQVFKKEPEQLRNSTIPSKKSS
jgi:hypothetical protein